MARSGPRARLAQLTDVASENVDESMRFRFGMPSPWTFAAPLRHTLLALFRYLWDRVLLQGMAFLLKLSSRQALPFDCVFRACNLHFHESSCSRFIEVHVLDRAGGRGIGRVGAGGQPSVCRATWERSLHVDLKRFSAVLFETHILL